jgi:hypothetical protein
MNKVINLSPEALEIVNEICGDEELECTIALLDNVEEQMQSLAFSEAASLETCTLYSMSYQLKTLKRKLSKLRGLLYYGRE